MSNWIWVDTETTGLDPEKNSLIEVALVVTDYNLNVLEKVEVTIHPEAGTEWNEWCVKQHLETGLIQESHDSNATLQDAEISLIGWLRQFCKPGESPMCGSSVHFDRAFLKKKMPLLEAFFHYRNIDVSAFKNVAQAWKLASSPTKAALGHRAMSDILTSIEHLRFYKSNYFQAVVPGVLNGN